MSQVKQESSTSYFAAKRLDGKDQVIAVSGCTATFIYSEVRTRGIKSWEKAKFENCQHRLKQQEYFKSINDAKRIKNKNNNNNFNSIQKSDLMIEKPMNSSIYIGIYSGNDAW